MTRGKLEDVLKYFKGGKHKILVATTVAEEGLDLASCNYVIRYEHVSNDIARVQARGQIYLHVPLDGCLYHKHLQKLQRTCFLRN